MIEYTSLISNFAAQTVRRDIFQLFIYFIYLYIYKKASFFWTAPGLIISRAGPGEASPCPGTWL